MAPDTTILPADDETGEPEPIIDTLDIVVGRPAVGDERTIEQMQHIIDGLRDHNRVIHDRLHLVGSAARAGIWEYDYARDELWVSDELAAMHGLDSTRPTWPEFASRLHPDDVVSELERPAPSYPFGSMNEFLIRVRHRDGRDRTIRSRSVTVGDHRGPARKLGAHIDVSENSTLRVNDELTEANERLRQFAYLASHDLRSPVRGIGQLVSFMVEDHKDSMPPAAVEMLDQIKGRAERMGRLVEDLLRFATSDLADVSAEGCDVTRLINDIVEMIDRRGKRLVIDCPAELRCSLAISPFTACLRNLIDNACKHHDKATGTVRVSAELRDGFLVTAVSDDGPGIPTAERRKVFEPFYTTKPGEGSGIGLAHVLRTATKHGAKIECAEAEVGTTFTIRWPVGGESLGSERVGGVPIEPFAANRPAP